MGVFWTPFVFNDVKIKWHGICHLFGEIHKDEKDIISCTNLTFYTS